MRRRRVFVDPGLGVLLAIGIFGGCSSSSEKGKTSTPGASAVTNAVAPSAEKPACPATGKWAVCNVLDRLERAGLTVRQDSGTVNEAPLTQRGLVFHVGRAELKVFLYPDESARRADEAKLDSTEFVSATTPLTMRRERTLISTSNLLGILNSLNDQQRERVSDALMAGPPQPAPTP